MIQFVLKALFNKHKDIKKGGVKEWVHGDKAFAIIQPYVDGQASDPIVVRNVVYQRAERRVSPQSGALFYFVVLQRDMGTTIKCSAVGNAFHKYLNAGREVLLLFDRVPHDEVICCCCGFKKLGAGPVHFEDGVVRCSPYCHVSSPVI